jgi:hypothetical protein
LDIVGRWTGYPMATEPKYEQRYCAFVDILGFGRLERFPFRRTISRIREVCSAFRSRDLIKTRGDGLAEAPDGERGILQSICGHFAQERLEFGE